MNADQTPDAANDATQPPAPPVPPATPTSSGPQRMEIPLPQDLLDEMAEHEPVLMHDDLRQIIGDVRCADRGAVALLQLLRSQVETDTETPSLRGVAVLLEGLHFRLQLASEALVEVACGLGLGEDRQALRALPN